MREQSPKISAVGVFQAAAREREHGETADGSAEGGICDTRVEQDWRQAGRSSRDDSFK